MQQPAKLWSRKRPLGSSPSLSAEKKVAISSGSGAGGSASGLGPEGRRFESCLPDKARAGSFGIRFGLATFELPTPKVW